MMSTYNLADIISAEEDPEEIFEILELLGTFFLFPLRARQLWLGVQGSAQTHGIARGSENHIVVGGTGFP